MFDDQELNSNVLYLFEVLRQCPVDLNDDSFDYDKNKETICRAILVCLHASSDQLERQHAQLQIFAHLLNRYFDNATILATPKLSFRLLLDLVVETQFTELPRILDCFESGESEKFYQDILVYLSQQQPFNHKHLLFSVDLILHALSKRSRQDLLDNLVKIVHTHSHLTLNSIDLGSYVNKSFHLIFKHLGLDKSTNMSREELICLEKQLKQSFEVNQDMIKCVSDLLSILTQRFTLTVDTLTPLRTYLYFLSLLRHESQFKELDDYLNLVVGDKYQFYVDNLFIIRHRLYKFTHLVNSSIFSKSDGITQDDLDVLRVIVDDLKQPSSVYSILRFVQSSNKFKSEFQALFWELFDKLTMSDKLNLIHEAYSINRLEISENKWLKCLYEAESFNTQFITVVNRLSANSHEDEQFVSRLTRLICISPSSVIDKLVFNAISNRNQIQSVFKILCLFRPLLGLKNEHIAPNGLILDTMESNFEFVLKNRSEKYLQNYESMVKLLLKEAGMEADEFMSLIVRKRLDSDTLDDLSLLFCLQIVDSIIKSLHIGLVDLVYLLEVNTINLESKPLSSSLMKLKEKCFNLIPQYVNSISYSSSIQSDELEWFKVYTSRFYWPLSCMTCQITKSVVLPRCIESIWSDQSLQVEYFDQDESWSVLESVLELISVRDKIQINEQLLRLKLESLGHDQILVAMLNVINNNRTYLELSRIFKFVQKLITSKIINVEGEPNLSQSLKKEEDLMIMDKYLNILTDITLIKSGQDNISLLMSTLIQNFKDMLGQIKDEARLVDSSLLGLYFWGKIALFVSSNHVQDVCGLTVECLNKVVAISSRRSKQKFDIDAAQLDQLKDMFNKLDPSLKSYKYLITQNLDQLLKANKL